MLATAACGQAPTPPSIAIAHRRRGPRMHRDQCGGLSQAMATLTRALSDAAMTHTVQSGNGHLQGSAAGSGCWVGRQPIDTLLCNKDAAWAGGSRMPPEPLPPATHCTAASQFPANGVQCAGLHQDAAQPTPVRARLHAATTRAALCGNSRTVPAGAVGFLSAASCLKGWVGARESLHHPLLNHLLRHR